MRHHRRRPPRHPQRITPAEALPVINISSAFLPELSLDSQSNLGHLAVPESPYGHGRYESHSPATIDIDQSWAEGSSKEANRSHGTSNTPAESILRLDSPPFRVPRKPAPTAYDYPSFSRSGIVSSGDSIITDIEHIQTPCHTGPSELAHCQDSSNGDSLPLVPTSYLDAKHNSYKKKKSISTPVSRLVRADRQERVSDGPTAYFDAAHFDVQHTGDTSPTPSSICIHDASEKEVAPSIAVASQSTDIWAARPSGVASTSPRIVVGHVPTQIPLFHFPGSHEGHSSARGSIHSGNTYIPDNGQVFRTRACSLPMYILAKKHSMETFSSKPERPSLLRNGSGSSIRRPTRKKVPEYQLESSEKLG